MVNGARTPRRDRTAIACSIAVHCCALAALVLLPPPVISAGPPDERQLLTSIIRIDRRRPPEPVRTSPAVVAARPLPVSVDEPALHVARTTAHAQQAMLVSTERRYRPPVVRQSVRRTPAAAQLESVRPDVAVQAVAAEPAAPSAAPAAATVALQRDDGIGNFGENYPAKADPQARSGLFEGVGGSVVLRIEIDESGRVTGVAFIRAPADPALKDALRSRVLAMRFIPAACNGLRCSDTIELHN